MYKDFASLLTTKLDKQAPKKIAVVAGAADFHVLEAVFAAQEKGVVTPLLVGDKEQTAACLQQLGVSDTRYELVHTAAEENPAEQAVALIREGRGDFLIKGKIETKQLLRPVLNKETGLNSKGFITHFGLMELAGYHKLLAMSDCAVIPYPTFSDKKKIVMEGVKALNKLGYERPIIGALCGVETVSEKMPETIDAQKLQELSESGELGNSVVLGPISYDLATSKESAAIKGYDSPYAGEVDMLLVPQMVTGNVMSKIWSADKANHLAGCLVGADIPIVLTSRSASMEEKLYSILLCAMLS